MYHRLGFVHRCMHHNAGKIRYSIYLSAIEMKGEARTRGSTTNATRRGEMGRKVMLRGLVRAMIALHKGMDTHVAIPTPKPMYPQLLRTCAANRL